MNKCVVTLALAGALVLGSSAPSAAALLGLTTGAPSLTAASAWIDYFDVDPDGDLSTLALVSSTDGIAPVDPAEIGFGIGFSLADPTSGPTGGFDVFDYDGLFLSGDLIAVGFGQDVSGNSLIELQFGNDMFGSAAASFGASVLAMITFVDDLGDNPFDALVDGESYEASITILNVVPLPAGLPLLLTGLFGIGWMRRGRRAKVACAAPHSVDLETVGRRVPV